MFKGGRSAHPIWEDFLRVTVDGKVHATYKIFSHQQALRTERMACQHSLCAKLHNQSTDSSIHRYHPEEAQTTLIWQPSTEETYCVQPIGYQQPYRKNVRYSQVYAWHWDCKDVLCMQHPILYDRTSPVFAEWSSCSDQATHHQDVKLSVKYCWIMYMTSSHRIWGTVLVVRLLHRFRMGGPTSTMKNNTIVYSPKLCQILLSLLVRPVYKTHSI